MSKRDFAAFGRWIDEVQYPNQVMPHDAFLAGVQYERDRQTRVKTVCGGRGRPQVGGCGKPIELATDIYRCTDCKAPFHRGCAQVHFDLSDVIDDARAGDIENELRAATYDYGGEHLTGAELLARLR